MRSLLVACIACTLVGCCRPAAPSPGVGTGLNPAFESEFDSLFLSHEPLRYQDNVQFLSSIKEAKLNPEETELVRAKLRAFLSAEPTPRPYAPDSEHTGVSSEVSFLRLQAVQVLAEIGTREDAEFLRGIGAKVEGEHPLFDEACQKAIEELETQ